MKLLSINVCEPRVVYIHGRELETGIFKVPVTGPVAVGTLNLAGDGQADLTVHGGPDKAVYLYSRENIDYWNATLHRDDLGPGSFGENLTVEGLGESEVAIGDEFAIGTACFLVTQPRLPCLKLALALETPSITKTFLESGRTGCYLRVLEEGTMQAGDAILPLPSREAVRVTIAEYMGLYCARRATREQFRRILSLAALPESGKREFTRTIIGVIG